MELQEIKKAFDAGLEQIKGLLKTQETEIKRYGASTDQTAKSLENAQSELTKVAADLNGFNDRVTELEKRSQRLGAFERDLEEHKSVGQLFTSSESYKQMLDSKAMRSNPVMIKSFFPRETRAVSSTGVSGLIVPRQRLSEIIAPARRKRHIRDLLTVRPTENGAIEYIKETGYAQISTFLTANSPAADTTLDVDNANGFYIGQKITLDNQATIYTVSAVNLVTKVITISTGLTALANSGVTVNSNTFAGTIEGNRKPNANLTFDLKTTPMKTVAHGLPLPRQVVQDVSAMEAYIDDRLTMGLLDVEDWHILFGDGSSTQLDGLMTDPNRQTYTRAGETKLEAIRKAMTKALVAEYSVTGVIVNHLDWEEIVLTKGTDGHYIYLNVSTTGGEEIVWAAPVIPTNAMPAGRFLVGAFDQGAFLWDREEANVRIADQHEGQFMQNMVQALAEERLAQTIFRPESFVDGTF
jgi:HK97 family phage major capsid protein